MLSRCHTAAHGIAFLPFFPVATGGHAGLDSPVRAVAAELGIAPAQAALAWLLRRSPNLVTIPGTGSAAHLAENMGALGVEMSADQFQRLADTA
ncbi:aldo/keto reductase [Streptomyces chartreusis]|uniref:aldo/keto reductase n=1 Tax=Streptomyces chartreusis TaxID=1969 RepID=UPI002E1890AA